MDFDHWMGRTAEVSSVVTLVIAWFGLKYARVAAEASQASLAAQKAHEAASKLSEIEQLILAIALGRTDRLIMVPEGGLAGFKDLVAGFRPLGTPFLPLRNHEIEHLLSLGYIEEAQIGHWNDPHQPNVYMSPRQVILTPSGVLRAKALQLDVPTLIERHQVHRGAP